MATLPRREPTFHAGEVALQSEAGLAERLARVGPQMIRDYLPEQHRQFFPLLPFVVVGSSDEAGQPTSSLLSAPPGFVFSPEPEILRVEALPLEGDPLESNLRPGAPLGLLGIQAHTRRRNRVNGSVIERDGRGFALRVGQSFGNCPKYIQPRQAFFAGPRLSAAVRVTERLDAGQRALIASADMFFIASAHPEAASHPRRAHGVDVSHRGGPPGFVAFTGDDRFVFPDYRGNNLYMTLGNLRLQPRAGLLFQDLEHGDLLQIDARTELITGPHPQPGPDDTGRLLCCHVERVRCFSGAAALRFLA
jgi:predicted pyridoxine 5'-phosphate oxidase superfamily flavin-nucleotide-binding protein